MGRLTVLLAMLAFGGFAAAANGVEISGGSSEVHALSITQFGTGIQLETSGGNTLAGNWIGLMTNGAAKGNGTGVSIFGGSTGNTIGGTTAAARNVISGNTND